MPHSHSQMLAHIIFSTKHREPTLTEQIRPRVFAYIATVLRDHGSQAFRVGGYLDHIHIACSIPRTVSQSKLINIIKAPSSKWIKEQFSDSKNFAWQNGYGIFSFSYSHLEHVLNYIDHQKEHHRTKTFQEEYLEFLKKYKIEFDEKYMWD